MNYITIHLYLIRCRISCCTLDDPSDKLCIPRKSRDMIITAFNMITGFKESKVFVKHISCDCR